MSYTPKLLKRWTMPDSYFGATWPDYYGSSVGQSRDSDALERSNFACMLEALGGESETVLVVRESHWAVGWVEWIAIHQDDERALQIADEIAAGLEDYPVIDEEHFSNLEFEEAAQWWEAVGPRGRYDMAKHELQRYHWLKGVSPLRWANMSFYRLGNDESPVSQAICEHLRA